MLTMSATEVVGLALGLAAIAYLVLALKGVLRFRAPGLGPAPTFAPPITVLKPICGAEARLYDCLRSFCMQDYPEMQIVFGVMDPDDAAVPTVRRLIGEFPELHLALIIDRRVHGTNPKIGNLANMLRAAKHPLVAISDSDVWITPDCLSAVVAPFEAADVGAVTCLYKAIPHGGLTSRLGALFINDWFVPSVLVDLGLREIDFCFGPVTVVRRDALDAIGGFARLANYLADDFMLGRLIAQAGYKVKLSSCPVSTIVAEPSFGSLFQHELRWARTVRTVRPFDHAMSVVTCALPVLFAYLLASASLPMAAVVAIIVLLRLMLHVRVCRKFGTVDRAALWLVPIREFVCFAVWARSLVGNGIRWRDRRYAIARSGELVREQSRYDAAAHRCLFSPG